MQTKKNKHVTISEWPAEGLESVSCCPVCGKDERKLLYSGLLDKVFKSALGKWVMYSCDTCGSAYLDPCPTIETIGLAYQNYYTHNEISKYSTLSILRKFRRRLANGYRNYHYGTQDFPASYLGVLVTRFIPNGRAIMARSMRHLPKIEGVKDLLDLGCGNGTFLLQARSAGYNVVGADFDARAVEVGCKHGLDVRLGGIESFDSSVEQFDVITLAHIIEHVHNPLSLLKACHELLKPSGFLWIETPNIMAEGHRKFGENWRGLEPPRHLVLFNQKSIKKVLDLAGFSEVEIQLYRPLCQDTFKASKAIADDLDPYSDDIKSVSSSILKIAEQKARANPERREFITVKAWKK
ncbi:MAG: class I SAM-dependent methyltransferase [Methylococcales bacterium]